MSCGHRNPSSDRCKRRPLGGSRHPGRGTNTIVPGGIGVRYCEQGGSNSAGARPIQPKPPESRGAFPPCQPADTGLHQSDGLARRGSRTSFHRSVRLSAHSSDRRRAIDRQAGPSVQCARSGTVIPYRAQIGPRSAGPYCTIVYSVLSTGRNIFSLDDDTHGCSRGANEETSGAPRWMYSPKTGMGRT